MTSKAFLITGLPRSRTLWMSEFMTTDRSICYHEPTVGMENIEDITAIYGNGQAEYIGISDCGLGFKLRWMLEHIKCRTLIIERDINEVQASLLSMNTGLPLTNFCYLLRDYLEAAKSHPLVMTVPFEQLNDLRTMQKIFWHLMPGVPFDEGRFDYMKNVIIEVEAQDSVDEVMQFGMGYLRDVMCQISAA